jgi:arylsulfatase A
MKAFTAALIIFLSFSAASAQSRPNFIVILDDDLGYGDLACYGSKEVQTPNLDRFATESLRLTSCYAGHPNCSPSRTALMTGRTPQRAGIRNWIPDGSPMHLRASEITIATLLKQAGYTTCHSGKWHLNGHFNQPTQPQPGDHGFDHWFSTQNNALPNHRNPQNFVRNGKDVGRIEGYAAHIVADEAISWLRTGRDKSKPFFLYVCFHEPHEPIASDDKYTRLYSHSDPAYVAHHGNITQMDDAFGRLMRAIDEENLRDNSFVFFTSDNGPAITPQHPYGSAGPLRDKKGFVTEGGIRVPGMIRWRGRVQSGATSDEPIANFDFLPTACEIVGIKPPTDRSIDGTSIVPVLSGKSIVRKEPLYWHFNRAYGDYQLAMRVGDWKILASLDKPHFTRINDLTDEDEQTFKTAEPVQFALYNLKTDIAETKDLASTEPAKFAELKSMLITKYHQVRAESPTWPAWKFDGREGQQIEWPDYVKAKQKTKAKTK